MTGQEHFTAAEELLAGVEQYGADFTPEGRADQIAIAQVHATPRPRGGYCVSRDPRRGGQR